MTSTIFVTEAQVKAAQMLVDQDRALGRDPDPATLKIAQARQELPVDWPSGNPNTSPHAAISFWDALDQDEQEALQAVASWQTFAAGKILMKQGEPADRVIVIFGGRTKISVIKDGKERVLAVRGLGQLVGERAALQVSVRSATVTALEVVWAMVVPSENFAVFVANHPRVMNILHDQLYDRLAEGPAEYESGEQDPGRLLRKSADSTPKTAPEVLNGENCTVVIFEVAEFGVRDINDRRLIRGALDAMIDVALHGIPDIRTQYRGDGFLAVLPSIPTVEVMSRLLKELPAAIDQHNKSHHSSARIQLRLAINVGPVFGDTSDVSGQAIMVASELLEAPHFEKGISDDAIVAIAVSPFVFEAVIRPGLDLNEVASYTQMPVELWGSSTNAWMKVIFPDSPAESTEA